MVEGQGGGAELKSESQPACLELKVHQLDGFMQNVCENICISVNDAVFFAGGELAVASRSH